MANFESITAGKRMLKIFFLSLLFVSCRVTIAPKFNLNAECLRLAEMAYFEGQYDAVRGDVKIRQVDSVWLWTRSPWCSGRAVTWQPGVWRKPCNDADSLVVPSKTRHKWW